MTLEHLTIPEIRERLLALADEVGGLTGSRIRYLANATYRRPAPMNSTSPQQRK
jgi:hypothetical protein